MASTVENATRLAAGGRIREAVELLERGAEAGDAGALFALACWRVSGDLIRRDLPQARALMERAGEAGDLDARRLHAHFLANGTGGAYDWARARALLEELAEQVPAVREQSRQLSGMKIDDEGHPLSLPELTTLSRSPEIMSASGLLSPEECRYLAKASEPSLRPSVVVDPASGRTLAHPDRKSDNMLFGVATEDLVVSAIRRRVAALCGVGPRQCEPLQIIRYGPGGEFRPHVDAFPATDNQRIATALVYLNEGYEGGETRFLETGLTFRGRTGDALYFRNVGADGRPDPAARHAGLPVLSGTKLILSCWIRERDYEYPPPRPRADL